jgi:1-acyl-sn-glycerol-3-phosphate acyltransferase
MAKWFYRIFGVYVGIMFLATLIVAAPFMLLTDLFKEPKKCILFLGVCKVWNLIWFFLTGSRIKVTGKEYFVKNETYIVIYNHSSFMDVPVSCPFTPAPNKTMGRIEFAKIPLVNIVYKRGSVLIDRNSRTSRVESYNAMLGVLAKNMHMCLFPEGTRNKTDEIMLPFKPGAFRLAIETGKSIIPAVITGTKRALPVTEKVYYKPSTFMLTFLQPISPVGHTEESLRDTCYNIMKDRLVNNTTRS